LSSIPVERSSSRLTPNSSRTITKPFVPTGDAAPGGPTRVQRILATILAMEEGAVEATLATTMERFSARHAELRDTFEASFANVARDVARGGELSLARRLLIGAYFTHEYSIESAALTNPSIVPAPDQSGLAEGSTRFILSLRAIGEGHISSVEFRTGVVDAQGGVHVDAPSRFAATARRVAPIYDKPMFRAKLEEMRAFDETASAVLASLDEHFSLEELERVLREIETKRGARVEAIRTVHWLASSNYESVFDPSGSVSERVLFPAAPTESHGMEDARFVRFEDKGDVRYFATYTAYDGYRILPQLLETRDFVTFKIATLNGPGAKNKGIALFPRRVGGLFAALARLDNENNFVMTSDNVRIWRSSTLIQSPASSWETMQIGNCGSPIETEAGWLVLTHGVGTMRQYAIGAILLDLADPTRVIGRLREPLLEAADDERDGYVPNVLYSCGAMVAGGRLVLPYGFSDVGTRFATVQLADVLGALAAQ